MLLIDEKDKNIKTVIENIKIQLIPYREHSNHMALFVCTDENDVHDNDLVHLKLPSEKNAKEALYFTLESVYYYKKGVSNKINPITISRQIQDLDSDRAFAANDNMTLLKIFYKYYLISRVFEETGNMIGYIGLEPKFGIESQTGTAVYDLYDFIHLLKHNQMYKLDGTFSLIQ